jgi:hypothetical protein
MAYSMIKAAADCLVGAFHLCAPFNASGVTPVEVLLRTALIGSCRTAFLLSTDNADERRDNALKLARIDLRSATQAWRILGGFDLTIQNAAAAQASVQEIADAIPSGDTPGEERIIGHMIDAIRWRLSDRAEEPLLRERLPFMWHGYSGSSQMSMDRAR